MRHWAHLFAGSRTCPGCQIAIAPADKITLVEIEESGIDGIVRWAVWHRKCNAADPAMVFSPRELGVGHLVRAGMPTAAIAERLGLSVNTVRGIIRRALRKIGCHSRIDIARFIRRAEAAA